MAVSPADAAHLLRRSGFGVTQARVSELTKLWSRGSAVSRVLDLSKAPTDPIPVPPLKLFQDQYPDWVSAVHWWLDRMATTPTPIVEKLTLFWHGHFTSGLGKVPSMSMLAAQNQLFRTHALGNYHTLAQAVAVDRAMLAYLDNWLNAAGAPQENFARELLELFTLGQGHYTQADVVSMARAWTGYSLDETNLAYLYRSTWHDQGTKQLFGGTPKNWDGPAALTEVIKGTARKVPASQFLTAKLFSYLAYPVGPTDPVVAPLATAFRSSGYNILSLVRAIFNSSAFWSTKARRALVRSPIEWMVATMQATGLSAAKANPHWWLDHAGQSPFNPPSVAGWGQNAFWLSTSASWSRANFVAYARWQARNAGVLASTLTATPPVAAEQALAHFGITDASPTTRAALETYVTSARSQGAGWMVQPNLILLTALSPEFQVA
jgi:uncharacterized protein (DUF1800 family)